MNVYDACLASQTGRAYVTRDGLHTVALLRDHSVVLWELRGGTACPAGSVALPFMTDSANWYPVAGVERDYLVHDRGDWRCLPRGAVNHSLSFSLSAKARAALVV